MLFCYYTITVTIILLYYTNYTIRSLSAQLLAQHLLIIRQWSDCSSIIVMMIMILCSDCYDYDSGDGDISGQTFLFR